MSLSEESEELLGKVRQALEALEVERKARVESQRLQELQAARIEELDAGGLVDETNVKALTARCGDARRENERLRLALQDAERRVKVLEQQVREMYDQGPFCGPEPVQAAENQGELCHRGCCTLTPEEIEERG